MANEPEPKSPFSAESQLNAFRIQLDQEAKNMVIDKIIPGFLFRDGEEKRARSLAPFNYRIAAFVKSIDDEQLEGLTQTYRRGLETRIHLLDDIRPVEILEMVREIWGKGEVSQRERGATLTYHYKQTQEIWDSIPGHHSLTTGGTFLHPGSFSLGERWRTGKWRVVDMRVEEEIGVDFNGYSPEDLSFLNKKMETPEMNEFFADEHYKQGAPTRFARLPRTILWRPENLGIYVTIPYTFTGLREGVLSGDHQYYQRSTQANPFVRFDQAVSQQEITDYLSRELEVQRRGGQLPSQVGALELAKIEELRKRGLLSEG